MKNTRVIFMGTPDFAVPVLEKLIEETNVVLVVSKPDAYVGRKHILTPSPVKKVALEHNIEVFTPEKLKNDYQLVMDKNADVIITCAYGQIVPKIILDNPQYGCINVHASLLPKYRGASPISKAIYDGEEQTGITIMYMDETLDTGNIIESESIKIDSTDTLGTLTDKLSVLGANLLIKTLPKILSGNCESIVQDDTLSSYAGMIKRSDERLNFNKTRKEVYNHIRSLNPEPLANILINGEEVKVLESRIGEELKSDVGIIKKVAKDSFSITCLDGLIDIIKIKPAGKKEMLVKDYFNGINKETLLNIKVSDNNE